jgi:hypothetical protein
MRRPKGGNGVVFRVLNQATKEVPIDSIQPHPRNVHEAPAAPLAESILENGFYGSIIVQQSTGYILVGKHRWKEAVAAGASKIPVTFIDVDDERGIKIMLADNRTGQLGADDPGQLASVLQDLGDLAGTGFSDGDLQALLSESSNSAFADASAKPAATVKGKRNLGNPRIQVKPVLYPDQVEIFERALKATKEQNRGNALMKVCRIYLETIQGDQTGNGIL